jgi:hypothetical protein
VRIYIAGPITGHPDLNEPAFRREAERLQAAGHEPVVPLDIEAFEHEGDCPPTYSRPMPGHGSACFLRADIKALLECDAIRMLPGWESSVGARLEHSVAALTGIPIAYAGGDLG